MSSPGNFSVKSPHSRPAWIAFTLGSTPKSFLYEATQASLIGDSAAGAQPGYSPSCFTIAPASTKHASILAAAARRAAVTQLRWLEPIRMTPGSVILTDARLVEVSTKFSISWLILSTPCGEAQRAVMRFHVVISSMAAEEHSSTGSYPSLRLVSTAPYSSATSDAYSSSLSFMISSVSGSAAMTALASRAIALRLLPPSIETNCQSRSRIL